MSAPLSGPTRTVIRCEGLRRTYGEIDAVRDFDLSLREGEIVALLGPSGCGKTTVLRLIAGFERPDAGRILFGDRLVSTPLGLVPPEQRHVGMVFQDYALFPHLTVEENVAFGLSRLGREEAATATHQALALVDLSGYGRRYPHELSGGEQQRVALARALAPRPFVLLLDEPFSNLDADLRSQMRREVREILEESGITSLFVTHDQQEALYMGSRVAVMHEGRVEQVDTPSGVFSRPDTRFVASFLGLADFLPARTTTDGLSTETGALRQRVDLPQGTAVEVMVRPDDVRLRPNALSGARIVERIYQGMGFLYRVVLPSGRFVHAHLPHTLEMEPGTGVDVLLDPGHDLVVFENGARHVPGVEDGGGQRAV